MPFLKLTRNKVKLLLLMIVASFIVGILFILINRVLVLNIYFGKQVFYQQIINFFINILRYIVISYLTLSFYQRKLSFQGKYYAIFKISALLMIFSFLYQLFLSYISKLIPGILLSNWINIIFVIANLAWYYVLVCIVYNFREIDK